MLYTENDIRQDLIRLTVKDFFLKYVVRTDNWYFREILNIPNEKILETIDLFKLIVSKSMNISFNNIVMVGSAKLGYSLSPNKALKKFEVEDDGKSDIDIAVISPQLFDIYWKFFRESYDVTKTNLYGYISRQIYRGYISEKNLLEIDKCRIDWLDKSKEVRKKLKSEMYFKHEINFRIYRDWNDMMEYHIQSIEELKRKERNSYVK
ncbi:hypothetical protein [Leptotrichia sp. oral taxon 212]|uniref:hypothetical protein n=1 Tax=Leptotrichia sp. oral taxon 212 TaxID=712357 RepID=UPI0006A955ED|nr:hypothetical protein [Leptotrichia sp. oral taxon 212]